MTDGITRTISLAYGAALGATAVMFGMPPVLAIGVFIGIGAAFDSYRYYLMGEE